MWECVRNPSVQIINIGFRKGEDGGWYVHKKQERAEGQSGEDGVIV